jgi:hypothetical protein
MLVPAILPEAECLLTPPPVDPAKTLSSCQPPAPSMGAW